MRCVALTVVVASCTGSAETSLSLESDRVEGFAVPTESKRLGAMESILDILILCTGVCDWYCG